MITLEEGVQRHPQVIVQISYSLFELVIYRYN